MPNSEIINPTQAVICSDFNVLNQATQQERDDATTQLFLSLTNALKNGCVVDISDPAKIVVTKSN